jgi:hypothetical protein
VKRTSFALWATAAKLSRAVKPPLLLLLILLILLILMLVLLSFL